MTQNRVRPRLTLLETPGAVRRVDERLKGIVERHQREVDLLKEMRLKEVNARKESELEVERLKEEMARLEMENRANTRSNLKAKLDEAAGPSSRKEKSRGDEVRSNMKGKCKVVASPVAINDKDAFLRAARRELRGLKKEKVVNICKKEGIEYTTLDPTKEVIAQKRTGKAFEGDDDEPGKGDGTSMLVVTDDGEGSSEGDGRDSTAS
ncbi:hypothetical protein CBR_g46297 [Chara braunii]|uniref:Uncharacterized protein n=1 Tax=Chara braunii TaxID=69332 RepID=A0A388M0C2_CHABU|nr:hypothetical protein CBR_g46297 [Chara braunii]|eukprot:GBG87929.1 hypothetical protein CBR_g46297 [Chara braunii]